MFWTSDWFDGVEEGEKIVYWIQDEEVSDWDYAYEPGDEFEGLEDRDGVFLEFSRVLNIIDGLVKANQFVDADELLERLFQMQMVAPIIWKYDGTEIDDYIVDADELFEATGLDGDYYSRLRLYVIVQRASAPNFSRLFEGMKQRKITDIDVIQTVGPKEVKAESFIDGWIAFLAETEGNEAYVLLKEACKTHKPVDFIEEHLSEFGQTHPLLFLDVLSKKLSLAYVDAEFQTSNLEARMFELSTSQLEDIKKVVKLANELISEELQVGAEVMEVGFELSERVQNASEALHYRKQAFLYRSSIVNYLRLRPYLSADERLFYKNNWRKVTSSGIRRFSTLPRTNDLARNTLDEDQLVSQLFFTEQFEAFFDACKKNQTSLGWSSNLLDFGVPLFLLLLNKKEEQSRAMKWMEGYVLGRLIDARRDRHYFSKVFTQFKYTVFLSEKLEEDILEWLGNQISQRTKALLDNKHRNAYYRAAELIIAYGEVLESRGESGARARTAEQYRKKYNQFNRFARELKERL